MTTVLIVSLIVTLWYTVNDTTNSKQSTAVLRSGFWWLLIPRTEGMQIPPCRFVRECHQSECLHRNRSRFPDRTAGRGRSRVTSVTTKYLHMQGENTRLGSICIIIFVKTEIKYPIDWWWNFRFEGLSMFGSSTCSLLTSIYDNIYNMKWKSTSEYLHPPTWIL